MRLAKSSDFLSAAGVAVLILGMPAVSSTIRGFTLEGFHSRQGRSQETFPAPEDGKTVENEDSTQLTFVDDQGDRLAYGRIYDHSEYGEVVSSFWLVEELYSTPSPGEGKVLQTVSCENRCSRPGPHEHTSCLLGTCSRKDEQAHQVKLVLTESEIVEKEEETEARIKKSTMERFGIGVNVGVAVGSVNVGVSAEYERTVTTEVEASIKRAEKSLQSRRVQINQEFEVGHFNDGPCSLKYRDYGLERRDLWVKFSLVERLYSIGSRSIGTFRMRDISGRDNIYGGTPRRLSFVGTSKYLTAGPFKFGSYFVPTNSPLKERDGPVRCACGLPPPTPTEGGRRTPVEPRQPEEPPEYPDQQTPGGEQSFWKYQFPEALATIAVRGTPSEDTKVEINNPYNSPLTLTNLQTQTTIEVQANEKRDLEPGWKAVAISVGATALYNLITGVDSPTEIERPAADLWQEQFKPQTPRQPGTTVDAPFEVRWGGLDATETPLPAGGVPPFLTISGDLPSGTRFDASWVGASETTPTPSITSLVTVTHGDRVKEAVIQLAAQVPSDDSITELQLTATTPSGEVLSRNMSFVPASITARVDPTRGLVGTPATLEVNYRNLLSSLRVQNPAFDLSRFELEIDYSQSGGASGPVIAPMNNNGVSLLPIIRGSIEGDFPLFINPRARPTGLGPYRNLLRKKSEALADAALDVSNDSNVGSLIREQLSATKLYRDKDQWDENGNPRFDYYKYLREEIRSLGRITNRGEQLSEGGKKLKDLVDELSKGGKEFVDQQEGLNQRQKDRLKKQLDEAAKQAKGN